MIKHLVAPLIFFCFLSFSINMHICILVQLSLIT